MTVAKRPGASLRSGRDEPVVAARSPCPKPTRCSILARVGRCRPDRHRFDSGRLPVGRTRSPSTTESESSVRTRFLQVCDHLVSDNMLCDVIVIV